MLERWATLSIRDLLRIDLLIPELLLYDRLITPFPENSQEELQWAEYNLKPDFQQKIIERLGSLAIIRPWGKSDTMQSQQRLSAARSDIYAMGIHAKWHDMDEDEQEDAALSLSSRFSLSLDRYNQLPDGVTKVDVVCSYRSEQELQAEFLFDSGNSGTENKSHLALLFGHLLAVPKSANLSKTLDKAIELSQDSDFKEKRRRLYRWQNETLNTGYEPQNAIREMEQLINEYNSVVKKSFKNVFYKGAFTLGGLALSLAGSSLGNRFATASGVLTVVRFAFLDGRPTVNAGETAPAAMFHDISAKFDYFKDTLKQHS